jgi:hypothetical protein
LGQRIIYFLNSLHQIIYFQQNTEQKNNLKFTQQKLKSNHQLIKQKVSKKLLLLITIFISKW